MRMYSQWLDEQGNRIHPLIEVVYKESSIPEILLDLLPRLEMVNKSVSRLEAQYQSGGKGEMLERLHQEVTFIYDMVLMLYQTQQALDEQYLEQFGVFSSDIEELASNIHASLKE